MKLLFKLILKTKKRKSSAFLINRDEIGKTWATKKRKINRTNLTIFGKWWWFDCFFTLSKNSVREILTYAQFYIPENNIIIGPLPPTWTARGGVNRSPTRPSSSRTPLSASAESVSTRGSRTRPRCACGCSSSGHIRWDHAEFQTSTSWREPSSGGPHHATRNYGIGKEETFRVLQMARSVILV